MDSGQKEKRKTDISSNLKNRNKNYTDMEIKCISAIAKRILEIRLMNGLSQIAISKKLGIKQPQYSRIEGGRQTVSINFLLKFFAICDIKPQEFFDGIKWDD